MGIYKVTKDNELRREVGARWPTKYSVGANALPVAEVHQSRFVTVT